MIKALNIASQGLLQAEQRATDIAKDILQTTAEASSFKLDAAQNGNAQQEASNQTTGTAPQAPAGGNFGNLIQQFADLRAEETAFKASATAFKKIDETLGTLLDDES